MVRKGNTFWLLIHIFTVAVIEKGTCLFLKEKDSIMMDKYAANQSQNQNLHRYYYKSSSNNTNIETTREDDDPNYPYEQILQLVRETKRIIQSSNETGKNQLNLDPSVYARYLLGDLSDYAPLPPFPYPVSKSLCDDKIEFREPRKLIGEDNKEYYIINVGKELKQQYTAILCRNPRSKCNIYDPDGLNSHFCETSFSRQRSFVSIPVSDKINLSQQQMGIFKIPNGCICSSIEKI